MLLSRSLLIALGGLAEICHAYTAVGRASSMAVLIGNKIFCQGGYTSVQNNNPGPATNEMIILPIDVSFQLSNPAYESDSGTMNGAPALLGQANFLGGYNNSGYYMFGGQVANGTTRTEVKSLYLFNTTHYNWQENPETTGLWPEPRDSASGIADIKTGDGYIFGGEPLVTGSTWLFNTTWRLQSGSSWSEIGGVAPGGGRQAHAVVMLTDGRMVILGGADSSGNAIPFTQILIFDTTAGTYSTKNATLSGSNPVPRLAHVAVSTYDNKIIIHGGTGQNNAFLGDLAVLDMNQTTLAWTVPTTSGTAPSPRTAHTAVMVGTQMFIMYGQTGASSLDNGVYVLDSTSWAWQTTYTPNNLQYTNTGLLPPPPPGSNEPSTQNSGSGTDNSSGSGSSGGNSGNNGGSGGNSGGNGQGGGGGNSSTPTGAIIGGTVGGVALVLILAALAAFAFLRRRRRQSESSVYPVNGGPDSQNVYYANNMFDSAPPYYQHSQFAGSNEFKNPPSSQAADMSQINTANHSDIITQKPNTPAPAEVVHMQKPNVTE
ncbi:hypothetical protein NQZ79_g7088 [Umbelopsis isabellina]|nr:hypothetical protein NQZ79_g7088 [Umbelopsis isabellina]